MTKRSEILKIELIARGWPTRTRASGTVMLEAPDDPSDAGWRAYRKAKAGERRPAGIK